MVWDNAEYGLWPPVSWPMTPVHDPVPENILSFLYFLAQFYPIQNKHNKAPPTLSSHSSLLSTFSSLVEHVEPHSSLIERHSLPEVGQTSGSMISFPSKFLPNCNDRSHLTAYWIRGWIMYSAVCFLFFDLNMCSSLLLSYGGKTIILTISKTPVLKATVSQRLSCSGHCARPSHQSCQWFVTAIWWLSSPSCFEGKGI